MANHQRQSPSQAQEQPRPRAWRAEHPLQFTALAFLLTVTTGLVLVAIVWFFSLWSVRGQLSLWAGEVFPPADAPEAAGPAVQPADNALSPVAIQAASDAPGGSQPITHVPLPEPAASDSGIQSIPLATEAPVRQEILFPQGELIIDPLQISMVPHKVTVREGRWDTNELWDRVGWLETTGTHPDDDMAMVFIGHVTLPFTGSPGPFFNLGQLEVGDLILYRTEEETFVYMVGQTSVVSPSEVQSLYRSDGNRLLLVTCTNWNAAQGSYDNRLLVETNLIVRLPSETPDG